MATRKDDWVKQLNELWAQALDQLDEVRDTLERSRGRLESEITGLREERDRLLRSLGEQTYRLANQGQLPMPTAIKRLVDRLNEVVEGLVERKPGAGKKASKKTGKKKTGKKKTAKKKTGKKKVAKKKSSKKKATKKTTAKKKTSKKKGRKKTTKKSSR